MVFLASTSPWLGIPLGEHAFLFSPMIAMTCTMLAIVSVPILVGRGVRPVGTVAVLGMVVTLFLAIRVAKTVAAGGVSGFSTDPAAGLLIVDNLSAFFQVLLAVFMLCVTWLWWIGSAQSERNAPEFFILLIGSALGMSLMVSTANLLMIIIAIEAASLPSYAIVGFDKNNRKGAEASLKYVIFGAVSAAIMIYGASLLYGLTGSLSIFDLAAYTAQHLTGGTNRVLLATGLLCFFAGIAFKISAVPFHFWCPDAFEGAKVEVTTWLSVASKAAGLLLLIRLVQALCGAADNEVAIGLLSPVAWAIAIVAAITCTIGNFSAYMQQSVKRMLAFSSIAHAGYMMMAAAVFMHTSQEGHSAGISALLAYIVIYLFMNLGAFGVTALVSWETGSDDIGAFTGLMRRSPWLAVPMVVCLMSLVGLPPFAGFIGKWWVLVALGGLDSTLGWFLVVVAVINTLISLYYYLRVIVNMTLRDDGQASISAPISGMAMVNFCALALLILFVYANPLKQTADRFSQGLFDGAALQVDAAMAETVADSSTGNTTR